MTDTYQLDALAGGDENSDDDPGDENPRDGPDDDRENGQHGDSAADSPVGVPIPEEHVGAFVAEAFEDAERNTTWEAVVDELVAPSARDAWADLSAEEQVVEVLEMADEFDRRAIERLESVPLEPSADVEGDLAEAKRLRRNADGFRDGVAAAYAADRVGDEELVAAVEAAGFDTDRIARREELLERVDEVHDVSYRPYGGTLFQESDREEADPTEPW